jgi:hypothetical protein
MKNKIPEFNVDFRKEYPSLKQNVNGVDIDLTPEEYEETIAQWEINQAKAKLAYEAEQTNAQIKATAEGKLAALGLTADDLRALGL